MNFPSRAHEQTHFTFSSNISLAWHLITYNLLLKCFSLLLPLIAFNPIICLSIQCRDCVYDWWKGGGAEWSEWAMRWEGEIDSDEEGAEKWRICLENMKWFCVYISERKREIEREREKSSRKARTVELFWEKPSEPASPLYLRIHTMNNISNVIPINLNWMVHMEYGN